MIFTWSEDCFPWETGRKNSVATRKPEPTRTVKTIDAMPASAAETKSSGRRVIIVEDQRLLAEYFTLHCRDLGLQVMQSCGSCSAGLAAIRQHRPTLVLMDISLPDGDG